MRYYSMQFEIHNIPKKEVEIPTCVRNTPKRDNPRVAQAPNAKPSLKSCQIERAYD